MDRTEMPAVDNRECAGTQRCLRSSCNFQLEKLPYGHTVIQTLLVNTPETRRRRESPYAHTRTILSMERRFA